MKQIIEAIAKLINLKTIITLVVVFTTIHFILEGQIAMSFLTGTCTFLIQKAFE